MNDHDQAVLDESFGHGYRWDDPVRRQPAPLLPPGMRCTAYFYAQQSGLLTGHGDMEFLTELGWHAAVLARWHQIPPWKVNEGDMQVHTWPDWVWNAALADMCDYYGMEPLPYPGADYPQRTAVAASWQLDEPGHGYWEAGDYG